eukprot:Em0006g1186a
MILIFILPCVLLAFFSKYLVRSSPTPKAKQKTLRTNTSTTTVTTEILDHCVQYAHNKLTFLEKLGGGFGTCSELWKAHLPAEPGRKVGGASPRSEDHLSQSLVCVRKLQEAHELHFQCLKAELSVLSSMPPHPHFLNIVGFSVNYRRPSFLIPGASQSDPAGLLFEYPWYGRLFAFLSAKRRAIVAGNRCSWSNLEQGAGAEERQHPHLLHPHLSSYVVTGSDASRPFLKSLGDPLDEIDLCVFALQIASAMEHLASRKLLHKRLCSECVAVSSHFHLKVTDVEFEVQQLHKSMQPNFPIIKKSPSGRRMFRWDAPEVLSNKGHTEKSEVWRFGMTLWEVASLGDTPFDDISDSTALHTSLLSGHHPQKPDGCPDHLYQVMECCWSVHPDKRPTFAQVMEMLLAEYEFVAGANKNEAVTNPLDTTSGASSSTEGVSSSPDRLIPMATVDECPLEQRRGSYPLTYRTGAARGGPLRFNGISDATTRM